MALHENMANRLCVFTAMVAGTACAGAANAQPPRADEAWSGHVSCQVDVRSDGYAHQETQTWTLTGGPPTSQGIQSYPATWSTTGQGAARQTQGTQVVSVSWQTNVAPTNTSIAIFVRASDHRLTFKSMHAQISAAGGHRGTRQVSGGGATAAPSSVQYPAYEWPLPVIEDSPLATRVNGSGTTVISGGMLPGHAASGSALANCAWGFSTAGLASTGLEPPRSDAGTPPPLIQIPAPVPHSMPAPSKTAVAPSAGKAPQGSEAPALLQVSPNSVIRGQPTVAVTLTGRSTHFDQQTTKVMVGAGVFVSVASVTVTSPTSLIARLNLASTRTPPSGKSSFPITVITGPETVQLFDAFHVSAQHARVLRK